MKKILAATIMNLSGLIIAALGLILNILGTSSHEDFGTALIVLGAIIWIIGLVLFILFKENKNGN